MADSTTEGDRLNPSELGTKSYWDNLYTCELTNHNANPSDEGTVWFDDSSAESRIVSYLTSSSSLSPQLSQTSTSFLDVGTGNGHLLFELIEEGEFSASNMVGIDYSEQSVELARNIAKQRGGSYEGVVFKRVDVIKSDDEELRLLREGGFDVVLDKGTFDAISLSGEVLEDGRRGEEVYAEKVGKLVKEDSGILLVTSCNWTEEELGKKMTAGGRLEVCGRISYPTFTFGGVKGQTVCSVVFRRAR